MSAHRSRRLHLATLLFCVCVISAVLGHVSHAGPARQDSPLETPTEIPVEFPTPTETPFVLPMETPFELPTETSTPAGTLPVEVATEAAEELPLPAETPTPLLNIPGERPIVQPVAAPAPDGVEFVQVMLASAASAAAWIWLACGSLIFFIVAGIVAGLYFAQQNRDRYALYMLEPEENPPVQPAKRNEQAENHDDIWPASLP